MPWHFRDRQKVGCRSDRQQWSPSSLLYPGRVWNLAEAKGQLMIRSHQTAGPLQEHPYGLRPTLGLRHLVPPGAPNGAQPLLFQASFQLRPAPSRPRRHPALAQAIEGLIQKHRPGSAGTALAQRHTVMGYIKLHMGQWVSQIDRLPFVS